MKRWIVLDAPLNNYEASTDGEIRSIKTGKILKPYIYKTGYASVLLNRKRYLVHRIIAGAFIENPENKLYVDHINTDRTDNRVENLRWVTGIENANNPLTKEHRGSAYNAFRTKEFRERQLARLKEKSKSVMCIETGYVWDSVREAAAALGIDKNRIYLSCKSSHKHATWQCKTYRGRQILHFKYIEATSSMPDIKTGVCSKSRKIGCKETGEVWESAILAAKATGLSKTYIYNACSRASNPKHRPITTYAGKPCLHFYYV